MLYAYADATRCQPAPPVQAAMLMPLDYFAAFCYAFDATMRLPIIDAMPFRHYFAALIRLPPLFFMLRWFSLMMPLRHADAGFVIDAMLF